MDYTVCYVGYIDMYTVCSVYNIPFSGFLQLDGISTFDETSSRAYNVKSTCSLEGLLRFYWISHVRWSEYCAPIGRFVSRGIKTVDLLTAAFTGQEWSTTIARLHTEIHFSYVKCQEFICKFFFPASKMQQSHLIGIWNCATAVETFVKFRYWEHKVKFSRKTTLNA